MAEFRELEDQQLLHQSAAGEKEALEEFVSRYGTAVYLHGQIYVAQ